MAEWGGCRQLMASTLDISGLSHRDASLTLAFFGFYEEIFGFNILQRGEGSADLEFENIAKLFIHGNGTPALLGNSACHVFHMRNIL